MTGVEVAYYVFHGAVMGLCILGLIWAWRI